jgi:hypothetical protein
VKVRLLAVLATFITAALVATGVYIGRTALARQKAAAIERTPISAAVMQAPAHDVGVVSVNLPAFIHSCGCRPNVSVSYVNLGVTVSPTGPHQMLTLGATPLLEILPYNATLSDVAAGKYDAWFNSYAQMVRGQQAQVLMSFAPEPNGDWYTWGFKNATPAQEIAAWRHVVTLFRAAGATNAIWVWIVNKNYHGSAPLQPLWPGAAYVDEVGIDGYFRLPADTFDSMIVPTLDQVRQLTSKPVFISETGANTVSGKARGMQMLTAGIAQYHVNGFVWFDNNRPGLNNGEPQDFAISGDQSSLALFRSALQPYQRPASPGE